MESSSINTYNKILNRTNSNNQDWTNLISAVKTNCKDFIIYYKASFFDLHKDKQLLSIDILDYLMDNSDITLQSQVSEKDFFSFLISLLRIKDNSDLQVKVLGLIEKWGKRFENDKLTLPNFNEVYSSLKKSGVTFPVNYKSGYLSYTNSSSSNTNFDQNFISHPNTQINSSKEVNKISSNLPESNVGYFNGIDLDLNTSNYPKKYQIFVGEIRTLLENIKLTNEMIDGANWNQHELDENVRLVVSNLMDLSGSLVMAIQNSIDHDQLMELCLGINDDIQSTFSRYEQFKKKQKPKSFSSVFFSDYAHLNKGLNRNQSSNNPSSNNQLNNIQQNQQGQNSGNQGNSNQESSNNTNKYLKD